MSKINLWKIYNLKDSYESEWSTCEHCGRLIKNVCELETEDKKVYRVWSWCVKTLLSLDWSDYWKNKEIEKQINDYFSMLRDIKKAEKIVYNDYFFWLKLVNKKGEKTTKLYYMTKVQNIDRHNWEYNNSDDTNCIASMNKYLLQ